MAKKEKKETKAESQGLKEEPARRAPRIITREEASSKIVDISSDIYEDIVKRKKKPDMRFRYVRFPM